MRKFLLGFFGTVALVLIGGIGWLRLGAAEVRADVPAPGWEEGLFHFAVRASVQRHAPGSPSPLRHTDEELIAGGKIYRDGCAGCHGQPGRPPRSRKLFLPPPEFAHAGTRFSEPELVWIIQHGIRGTGMSAYGDYSERQLWLLANFVQRMKDLPPAVGKAMAPAKP